MDLEDWGSDEEFEATILDLDAREVGPDSSTQQSTLSRIETEPVLPNCSTPRHKPHTSNQITAGTTANNFLLWIN